MAYKRSRRNTARVIGVLLLIQLLVVAAYVALWGGPMELMLVDVAATVPLVISTASAGQSSRLEKRYIALASLPIAAGTALVVLATPDPSIRVASVVAFIVCAVFALYFDWFSKPLATGGTEAGGQSGGAAHPSGGPSPVPSNSSGA